MTVEVDYAYYTGTYGGTETESAFLAALPAARRHVRRLTNAGEPGDDEADAYRRALCAAAEVFAELGEGQVGGFSIGSFSMTRYVDEATTGTEQATAAALAELVGTSLIFTGVR